MQTQFRSRLVASALLAVQASIATVVIQEFALIQTGTQSTYAAQAQSSDSLATTEIYRKTKPAIVYIETRTRHGKSKGSGVILRKDGLIVTNAHVIKGAKRIIVELSNGKQVKAYPVASGQSGCVDLALLKLEGKHNLPTVTMASSPVIPGTNVFAMGFPKGIKPASITKGIVSNVHQKSGYIQLDAAINKGNSGGALLNSKGELIGINTWKFRAEGLNFATSIDRLQATLQAYKNGLSPILAKHLDLTAGRATQLVADQKATVGRLQSGDQRVCSDRSLADVYTFKGKANQGIILEMQAKAFDPHFILLNPKGRTVARKTAQPGKKFTRLYQILGSDGTYTLIANSRKANRYGSYKIRAITPVLLRASALGAGDPRRKNGSFFRSYHFSAQTGRPLNLTVSSQAFSPHVALIDAKGKVLREGPFPSGKTRSFAVLSNGRYSIRVSSTQPKQAGHFSLIIEAKPTRSGPKAIAKHH
ncbi:trypsin-like peptidase domain-containing protein [filamentous cyanobacterium LEGE 11480]|uniref:Trypsin-like peptidase domain-containing protein n=1 Tax=Romeriopsis navalis LEGE 11480 TaxID=2777977 RepID=A0A928VS68_9CYAN|nr:trypsin-like peptidase domain-containing protein [Romeriopsis navalis]MBE9031214.1 trypsin-like peptidase domain-containing protein [Romeriopsis navalis LEGE 11480]